MYLWLRYANQNHDSGKPQLSKARGSHGEDVITAEEPRQAGWCQRSRKTTCVKQKLLLNSACCYRNRFLGVIPAFYNKTWSPPSVFKFERRINARCLKAAGGNYTKGGFIRTVVGEMWRAACQSWKAWGEWVQTCGRTPGAEIVFCRAVWTKPAQIHMKVSLRHTDLVLRKWNLCISSWLLVVSRNYSYHRKRCWSGATNVFGLHEPCISSVLHSSLGLVHWQCS